MKNQPFLLAAAALAAGILVAPSLWPWRPAVCLAAVLGGLTLAAWYWWRRALSLPLAGLVLTLGGALLLGPPLPSSTAARVTAVRGWLDGEIQFRGQVQYAGARLTAWRLGNGPWSAPGRGIRVWLSGTQDAQYGRRIEARGRFYAAPWTGVAGYFYPKTIRYLPGRVGNPLRRWALALRTRMEGPYRRYLGSREYALLTGLVFGDLPRLPDEVLAWFRDTGGLHLLSVSGLHIGFVVALVLGVASLLGWRGWRAWALVVPALLVYVALCGPKPPVLRAAVMALGAGVGVIGRRRISPGNLLGLAALFILLFQPWALETISFQLSFAATAGLIFLYPRWAAWCPPRLAFVGKPLLISLAATMAVLPIQTAAFGRVSLIAPLANLVLVPLAGLAVQIGLVAGALGALWSPLAGPLLVCLGFLIDLLLLAAKFLAQLPGAAYNLGGWPAPLLLGYYLFLGMVGFGVERNLLNRRLRLSLGWLTIITAAALAVLVWWQVLAAPKGLSVTFLDVGQGDCIFIRSPDGRTALIDGGEDEAGPRVLAYLRKQGVNRLDLLILTHPHSDHAGGLTAVAREMAIGRVLDPGWTHTSEVYRRFLLVLQERKVPWHRARRGLAFTLGRDVTGTVLSPWPGEAEPEEMNRGSLVIRLKYGQQVLLLPGDLDQEGEGKLLATGDDLRATVLKVAHHGSGTSTGAAWLAAVRPRAAVIPVGRNNQFHHPHPDTLARLRAAKVKVYRTDLQGTIRWVTDGKRYRFEVGKS